MSTRTDISNPTHLRAVLWDMDGTLIDSSEFHWLSWRDALAAEGYNLTHEQFLASFGQRNDAILRGYFGEDMPLNEIERISEAKEVGYRKLVRKHGIDLLPGVERWLRDLKQAGWRQAVASSAPRPNLETIIDVLNIGDCFDALVTAEDVQHGKPAPDVFLKAADQVGVPPESCIVVEDAPAGIEAARRAGMRAIGVRSSHGNLQADQVVQSLADLPEDAFDRLLAR